MYLWSCSHLTVLARDGKLSKCKSARLEKRRVRPPKKHKDRQPAFKFGFGRVDMSSAWVMIPPLSWCGCISGLEQVSNFEVHLCHPGCLKHPDCCRLSRTKIWGFPLAGDWCSCCRVCCYTYLTSVPKWGVWSIPNDPSPSHGSFTQARILACPLFKQPPF